VINVLRNTKGISFTHFGSKDVVRHPLVQRIVDAYEAFTELPSKSGSQNSKSNG
jgi:phosphate starvation-inducible PhoH-like protein